jgi:predicted Zn-dependent protease
LNDGVKLLQASDLDEAISLFRKALAQAPNNQVLNMNCAQAYLMKLKGSGKNKDLLNKARECLDKTADNSALKERYKTLNDAYWKVSNRK